MAAASNLSCRHNRAWSPSCRGGGEQAAVTVTRRRYFFSTAKDPLVGIQDTVSDAVAEAQAIIDSTGWVGDDM